LAGIAGKLKRIDPDGKTWVEGDGSPEKVLSHLIIPSMDTASFIEHCHLATVPRMNPCDQDPFLLGLLQNESEVAAKDAVETFYQEHRYDTRPRYNADRPQWRTRYDRLDSDTAEQMSEYGQNLATLADTLSRHRTATTGGEYEKAPQLPTDPGELKDVIKQLEYQLEGVMFVVSVNFHSCRKY
jgi:hypothetical protein